MDAADKRRHEPVSPLTPDFARDLFSGTAEYYARYRVPYPENLLADLRLHAGVTGQGRLLDVACGTGELALPLAPSFSEVWAVDQEPEMIEVARRRADERDVTNVQWSVGRAEDLELPSQSLELITIGAAFHRVHRPLLARQALEWLEEGRSLAVLGSNSVWTGKEAWQAAVVEVIAKWTSHGDAKRRRPQTPVASHREVLEASGFVDVREHRFPTLHLWTPDSFIGYLYSTSVASKSVLGHKRERFEADIRRTLLKHDASGEYLETIDFFYILARRPRG